jgi:outer membrane protein assembly factor BamB
MSTNIQSSQPYSSPSSPSPSAATQPARPARFWPAVVLIAVYWAVRIVANAMDMTISAHFITSVLVPGVLVLLLLVWWLTCLRIPFVERFAGLMALGLGTYLASKVTHPSIGLFAMLFYALPLGLTLWTAWLALGGRRSALAQRWGAALASVPFWVAFALVRMNGLDGDLNADMHWRWTPSHDETYKAVAPAEQAAASGPLELAPGDWPALRGPSGTGEVHGVRIATDWAKSPPKQIWRAEIGPGWSSFAVIGDHLFTAEQRDEKHEGIVCLDARTGKPVWVHADEARHYESQGGPGPRGTPAFDSGRIYALGATGILNCLDAASGKPIWSKNIAGDANAKEPMWGFSASPLIVDGNVIVYAGGGEKGLLAYNAASGKLAWTAPTGTQGYCSPQLAWLGGQKQVMLFDDAGVVAVDPSEGAVKWRFKDETQNWRATQPHAIGDGQVLFASEDTGLVMLDVKPAAPTWTVTKRWASQSMKSGYNDFVVLDGSIYGFNVSMFSCVDAETGERRWKGGRYGHGQVLLLADQKLLLVLGENGEVHLLTANPNKLEELGKFQALNDKTWNHPVVARGRLYVRNDRETACYDLGAADAREGVARINSAGSGGITADQ